MSKRAQFVELSGDIYHISSIKTVKGTSYTVIYFNDGTSTELKCSYYSIRKTLINAGLLIPEEDDD